MKLPGPHDLFGALERGVEQVDSLRGVAPRVIGLLDVAEAQLRRIAPAIDAVTVVTSAAASEIVQVQFVRKNAQAAIDQTMSVVAEAQSLVDRVTPLLDRLEPSLTALQPSLEVLAETTNPAEVEALVTMVNHLPELTRLLESDVLPVMGTLATVAPDLRDLLAASSDLNEIIGKVPGVGRIKRNLDEEREEEKPAS